MERAVEGIDPSEETAARFVAWTAFEGIACLAAAPLVWWWSEDGVHPRLFLATVAIAIGTTGAIAVIGAAQRRAWAFGWLAVPWCVSGLACLAGSIIRFQRTPSSAIGDRLGWCAAGILALFALSLPGIVALRMTAWRDHVLSSSEGFRAAVRREAGGLCLIAAIVLAVRGPLQRLPCEPVWAPYAEAAGVLLLRYAHMRLWRKGAQAQAPTGPRPPTQVEIR